MAPLAQRIAMPWSALYLGLLLAGGSALTGCDSNSTADEPILPSCSDGVANQSETDVDCGASCTPCGLGKRCSSGADCSSGLCESSQCVAAPSCSDNQKNGQETDVDCGGSCRPCVPSRACVVNSDCDSGMCLNATCGSPACAVQNLVLMVGISGAHGYPQLLWPHPDSYIPGRFSETLPTAFMQPTKNTGAVGSSLGGTLSGVLDYSNPVASAASGYLGAWAAGERFKRVTGVDNQAFGGFRSSDASSRAVDQTYYGQDSVPVNAALDSSKKFIVAARETPWLDRYGLSKSMTIVDGGVTAPVYIRGAHNTWLNFNQRLTLMAAAAVLQLPRKAPVPVVFVPGYLQQFPVDKSLPFYGENLPASAPAPLLVANAAALVTAVAAKTGVAEAELTPTAAEKMRYGFTGTGPTKLVSMRDNMIVAAKLLQRGITSQIAIGYFEDGPASDLFSAVGNGAMNASTAAVAQSNLYNAFMDDLMAVPDPSCPQRRLGDNTVIAMVGDTPQDGVCRQWQDYSRPSGAQNRMWIMSGGFLKTGAFGGDRARYAADCNNSSNIGAGEGGLYDLVTGDLLPFGTPTGYINGQDLRTQYGETAAAAVLYSVVRGRLPLVSTYYQGPAFPALLAATPPK